MYNHYIPLDNLAEEFGTDPNKLRQWLISQRILVVRGKFGGKRTIDGVSPSYAEKARQLWANVQSAGT